MSGSDNNQQVTLTDASPPEHRWRAEPEPSRQWVWVRVQLAWSQSLQPLVSLLWSVVQFAWFCVKGVWYIGGWQLTAILAIFLYYWNITFGLIRFLAVNGLLGLPRIPEVVYKIVTPAPPPQQPPLVDWSLVIVGLCLVEGLAVIFLILKPRRVVRVCEHGFLVEKTMQGSEYITTPGPDFVLEVWGFSQGQWTRRGTGFRTESRIITVKHVLIGCERVKFVYRGQEAIVTAEPKELDMDLVSFDYEPFSGWQMGSGRLVKETGFNFVTTSNGQMQSYGRLQPAQELGFVEYHGSTLPGFSGAPYFAGRRIFGVHCGAGVLNLGYDAAFLRSLLTDVIAPEAMSDEDTDPGKILRKAQEAEDYQYRRMGNDYVSVRAQGKFFTMSESDFERLKGGRKSNHARYSGESAARVGQQPTPLPATTCFDYVDSEAPVQVTPPAGNGVRLAAAAMPPAGLFSQDMPKAVSPLRIPLRPQALPTPSPRNQLLPTPQPTPGPTSLAALQSALLTVMSGGLPTPEEMAALSKNGQKRVKQAQELRNWMNA